MEHVELLLTPNLVLLLVLEQNPVRAAFVCSHPRVPETRPATCDEGPAATIRARAPRS